MKHCDSKVAVAAATTEISRKSTNVVDYDPHYKCNLVKFGIVQKIPYESSDPGADDGYNNNNNNSLLDVDFSSACLRCGICLAVAQKVG